MTVAPAYKDLFTKRYRKVAAPSPSEYQIQIALIARLKLLARKDCIYFHVPNGELRDKRAAAKLKAMGVMPGVPDLIFIWPESNVLFMELKAKGRPLSEEQKHFAVKALTTCGVRWVFADSLDEAVRLLEHNGIMGRGPARIGRLDQG